MANNKIIFNGNTLIDLTADTVTESDVLNGKTFHKANGESAIGTGAGPDTITDCRYLFALSTNRINELINTKVITKNVAYMFYKNINLTDQILSDLFNSTNFSWDITDTDMTEMLFQCSRITNFDFNNINTGNLSLNLFGFFNSCKELQTVTFKQMYIQNMSEMFNSCKKLNSIDLSLIDNVYGQMTVANMFSFCSNLTSVTFPSITTPYVYFAGMFSSCSKLTTLTNIENFVKTVRDTNKMFFGCSALTSIKLPYFKIDNYSRVDLSYTFYQCTNLHTIDLLWDCSDYQAYNTSYMFANCSSLQNLIIRWTGGVAKISSQDTISSIPATCNIYVPDNLVDQYKVTTNWVTKANQIKPLSEYIEE